MKKNNIKVLPSSQKRTAISSNCTTTNLASFVVLPARLFSTTLIRKVDPLGTTVLAFNTPYAPSLLANPFGIAFVLLMGMGVCLFYLTQSLPESLGQSPEYIIVIQQIDNLLLLYERFLYYEQYVINMLLPNLDNFTPEALRNYYLALQELVTVRESAFNRLNNLFNLPEIQFLGRIIVDRIENAIEELRLSGNNLMFLVRNIETRLNIPEGERIPPF